jgi:hypothetical protein
MTTDDLPPPRRGHIFDRTSLGEEYLHQIRSAAALTRDLRRLASDVLFLSLYLESRNPRIDLAMGADIRCFIDLARLLVAALPASSEAELELKLAALTPPEPLIADHVNLRAMAESGARADIQRLKLSNPPKWILDWATT